LTERKVNKNVLLLGIVSFLNDLSSEMVMPILPVFITALGGTEAAVGLIGGLRDSLSSLLKVFSGWYSDKLGKRKIFVFSGYAVSAVFKIFLGFSSIWQHVLVFSSFERIGKGIRTAPRDALISVYMPGEKGRGFGIHRAMDTAGAILGSITAFFLFWFLGLDFKIIILTAAGFSFVSLIPLKYVSEVKSSAVKKLTVRLSLTKFSSRLRKFIVIAGVFALSDFSYMFFILRSREAFSGKLSTGIPILLYVLFNIFYALFSVPFGKIGDRAGRKRILIAGYGLFSLTCLGFAFFKSLYAFIILFALYGTVYAVVDGNQRAFVSDISEEDLRGTALGTFHTVTGLAALPASIAAGLLWRISASTAFFYGAAVSLLSVIFFMFSDI